MKTLGLLTAVVAAAATLATASAAPVVGATVRTAVAPKEQQPRERSLAARVRDGRQAVVYFRQKTWSVQRRIPVRLTPTHHAERRTKSPAYLYWLKNRWYGRWNEAKRFLAVHRLPLTNDWTTAVRIVQRAWPGTATWLLSCSGAEGGHGIWVWNGGQPYSAPYHGSGVGGWMQYASGTFWGNFHHALAAARTMHRALPLALARAASWTNALGQAFAAGWARYAQVTTGYPGSWPWTGDPYCA